MRIKTNLHNKCRIKKHLLRKAPTMARHPRLAFSVSLNYGATAISPTEPPHTPTQYPDNDPRQFRAL